MKSGNKTKSIPSSHNEVTKRIEKIANEILSPEIYEQLNISQIQFLIPDYYYEKQNLEAPLERFVRLMAQIVDMIIIGCSNKKEQFNGPSISRHEYDTLPKKIRKLFVVYPSVDDDEPTDTPDEIACLKKQKQYRILFKNKKYYQEFDNTLQELIHEIDKIRDFSESALRDFDRPQIILHTESLLLKIATFAKIIPEKHSVTLSEYFDLIRRKNIIYKEYHEYASRRNTLQKSINDKKHEIKNLENEIKEHHKKTLNTISAFMNRSKTH